jgi:putative tricarboxylic transport membrane protein
MSDWILAVCTIIGALGYLYADSQLPEHSIGDPLGPTIFPAIIGLGLLGSGLLLMLETYNKKQAAAAVAAPAAAPPEDRRRQLILVGVFLWTAIYYVAFEPVGYIISTIVFLMGLLSFFHRGKQLINIAVAVGFTAFAYTLFDQFLGVSMPPGLLDF